MAAPNDSPAHWSKDFVEHLRTVHFTLIALCLGLIVLTFFPSRTAIKTASAQAAEVFEASKKFKSDILQNAIDERIRTDSLAEQLDTKFVRRFGASGWPQFSMADLVIVLPTKDYRGRTFSEVHFPVFENGCWREVALGLPPEIKNSITRCEELARFPVLDTLRTFRLVWDWSLKPISVGVPALPTQCKLIPVATGQSWTRIDPVPTHCELKDAPSEWKEATSFGSILEYPKLVLTPDRDPSTKYGEETISGSVEIPATYAHPNYRVALPVAFIHHVELTPQEVMLTLAPELKNTLGMSFENAFGELRAVDGAFETADLESAMKILTAEADREGDAFEAVGMKIPAEIAVRFGVLLILGVQLYMWIHLREFGNRIERDAGFEVAWIGVYFSRSARVVFFATLLVLPWFTVFVLSIQWLRLGSTYKHAWWAVAVTANVASLVLSYLIVRVLPKPTALEATTTSPSRLRDGSLPTQLQ